jgi:hypothetical protein
MTYQSCLKLDTAIYDLFDKLLGELVEFFFEFFFRGEVFVLVKDKVFVVFVYKYRLVVHVVHSLEENKKPGRLNPGPFGATIRGDEERRA